MMSTHNDRATAKARSSVDRADKTDAVMDALRTHAPATVAALCQATGFSRPTVTAILTDLHEHGITEESSASDQLVGRPAASWELAPTSGIVMAVDILATSILVVVATMNGEIVAAQQHDLTVIDDGEARLDQTVHIILTHAKQQEAHGQLRALGVSVTGVIDAQGIIQATDYVPAWNGFPLADRMRSILGVPVVVENDINMAACGEFTLRRLAGDLAPNSDLLLLQFNRGPRTGLILEGQLRRGQRSKAGEVSDLIDLHPDSEHMSPEEWAERTALAIASVTAIVDLQTIVIGAVTPIASQSGSAVLPSPSTEQIIRRLQALTSKDPQRITIEDSRLGAAGSVVGALHGAFDLALGAISGLPHSRPVLLKATERIDQALSGSTHLSLPMIATAAPDTPSQTSSSPSPSVLRMTGDDLAHTSLNITFNPNDDAGAPSINISVSRDGIPVTTSHPLTIHLTQPTPRE